MNTTTDGGRTSGVAISAPPDSIAERLGAGTDTFAMTFAGLGWSWWESLENVIRDRHDLRRTATRWQATVQDILRRPEFRSTGLAVGFDPLHDESLPPGVSGLLVGGGFPQIHASDLAANAPLRRARPPSAC